MDELFTQKRHHPPQNFQFDRRDLSESGVVGQIVIPILNCKVRNVTAKEVGRGDAYSKLIRKLRAQLSLLIRSVSGAQESAGGRIAWRQCGVTDSVRPQPCCPNYLLIQPSVPVSSCDCSSIRSVLSVHLVIDVRMYR